MTLAISNLIVVLRFCKQVGHRKGIDKSDSVNFVGCRIIRQPPGEIEKERENNN